MKSPVYYLLLLLMLSCAEKAPETPSMVYVKIEDFTHQYVPSSTKSLPVSVQSRGEENWEGKVEVMLQQNDSVLLSWQKAFLVLADSDQLQSIDIQLPEEEGVYHLVARIYDFRGKPVLSRRLIEVKKPIRVQINP